MNRTKVTFDGQVADAAETCGGVAGGAPKPGCDCLLREMRRKQAEAEAEAISYVHTRTGTPRDKNLTLTMTQTLEYMSRRPTPMHKPDPVAVPESEPEPEWSSRASSRQILNESLPEPSEQEQPEQERRLPKSAPEHRQPRPLSGARPTTSGSGTQQMHVLPVTFVLSARSPSSLSVSGHLAY